MRSRYPVLVCVCAVLLLHCLDLEAQNSADTQIGSAGDGAVSATRPAVRNPGAATGRSGGVTAASTRAVPPDTRTVVSPDAGPTPSPGASAGSLNIMQQQVLDRVNHYRTIAGVAPVRAEAKLLNAAQSHASYLGASGATGHYETNKSNPYYTGYSPFDRILVQRYEYVAAGEVVASESSSHPARAIDALMAAIYHRFIILSSDFTQAGPGVALNANRGADVLDVTVDLGAEVLPQPLDPARLTLYPFDRQQRVPTDFDPAQESPDPMPGHTLVGYPLSVQADPRSTLVVERFELHEISSAGLGRRLDANLLTRAVDAETPANAAALISSAPLAAGTAYRAVFSGSVDGQPVTRMWEFNTAAEVPVTMTFASPSVAAGGVQRATLHGLDTEKGPYYLCYSPARLVSSLRHESEMQFMMTTAADCEPGMSCQVTVQATYHSTCSAPFAVGSFDVTRKE